MTFLYSCRHDGDQYRITKLTENLDVESSYLCTFDECECPAGVRPTCRHREMLPKFVAREAIGTGWFLDYDRGGWVDCRMEDENDQMPPLPEGVQMFSLDDPATVHNAIADAIGEPEAKLSAAFDSLIGRDSQVERQGNHNPPSAGSIPAPATKPWRRF